MLDRGKHEAILKNILRDIYQHHRLGTQLAFKGGTCLYLFHGLPRFSTDLDFSLVQSNAGELDLTPIRTILAKYLTVVEDREKHFTWFWLGRYAKDIQSVKVEISKRSFDDAYSIENYLGVTVRTLDLATMFAHKLCAISDRREMVNRDLFDTWWLLTKMVPIRSEIIIERTGMNVPEYLGKLMTYIPKNLDRKHIVSGLGEVLTRSQKDWTRDHLLDELMAQLQIRLEAEE